VRFEDVDAAGIVFFARFLNYAHDAMERLFEDLPGGYAALIMQRRIGFPAVHAATDFAAPLRYGDTARIAVTIEKIGRSSCALRYVMTRAGDGVKVASILHVCAVSDLRTVTAIAIPDDMRAVLEAHAAT
jgi:4-hydroxybenzoyl-CoA thioesterase